MYFKYNDSRNNVTNYFLRIGFKLILFILAIIVLLQVIDSYDTGTTFNQFMCLNIDITNGNVYGVDLQGSQYRFILLNNFLVKLGTQLGTKRLGLSLNIFKYLFWYTLF